MGLNLYVGNQQIIGRMKRNEIREDRGYKGFQEVMYRYLDFILFVVESYWKAISGRVRRVGCVVVERLLVVVWIQGVLMGGFVDLVLVMEIEDRGQWLDLGGFIFIYFGSRVKKIFL